MDTDGTNLKNHTLDFSVQSPNLQLIAWPPNKDYLILMIGEKLPAPNLVYKILKIDLEDGRHHVLVENVINIDQVRVSPGYNFLAFSYQDPSEGSQILAYLNLNTLEKKEIFRANLIKLWTIKWNQSEDRIAFSRDNELWVYSLVKDASEKISQRNYSHEIGFDWINDGQKLVLIYPVDGENNLMIFGEDLKKEKMTEISFPIEPPIYIWGLDNKVLVKSLKKGPLWRVDLETEEWKKIY